MRAIRWIVLVLLVGAVFAVPTAAAANGGAYIEFDKTHYLAGETAVGRGSVFVPQDKRAILERGPFYAFLLTKGTSIREGRPIPDGVIRLGTFSIESAKGKWFDLQVAFAVPELAGEFYSVAVCNDPCTVSGFREPLTGTISIVETAREGQLLSEQERLGTKVWGLRRDARKAGRRAEELQAALDVSERERSRLSGEVNRLEAELADAGARARAEDPARRPLIDPWAAAGIVIALLVLAGALLIRRRRPARIAVPDAIAELEPEPEPVPEKELGGSGVTASAAGRGR